MLQLAINSIATWCYEHHITGAEFIGLAAFIVCLFLVKIGWDEFKGAYKPTGRTEAKPFEDDRIGLKRFLDIKDYNQL